MSFSRPKKKKNPSTIGYRKSCLPIPDRLVEDVPEKEQAPSRDGAGERLHFEKLEMIYSEILAFNRACRSVGFISRSQPWHLAVRAVRCERESLP